MTINWTPEAIAKARQIIADYERQAKEAQLIADAFAQAADDKRSEQYACESQVRAYRERMATDGVTLDA